VGDLIYMTIASLDGYMEDENGDYQWSAPDEEVHAFINELVRPVGTHLYGRRMYEVMRVWESPEALPDATPAMLEFADVWRPADKVVYSRTLEAVTTDRTRLERDFDAGTVRDLKASAERDLTIGGPELAAHAIRAGLVDEYQLLVVPMLLGGGIRSVPDGVRLGLELVEERRFGNGFVFLRYRAA
jgi:dihydrofolate reductase